MLNFFLLAKLIKTIKTKAVFFFFCNFAIKISQAMHNESGTTVYKQSLGKQIISTAMEAFTTKGIKTVKMDDIARELSISKRTLYELFSTKEELLLECVKEMRREFTDHMDKFINSDTSVIAIIIETYRYQMSKLTTVSPAYYEELHRYPTVIKWLDEARDKNEGEVIEFYKRGVAEGYFRSDVDFALIGKVTAGTVDYIMGSRLFRQYSMAQIFHNVILLYVRGFCTLKGVKALEKL